MIKLVPSMTALMLRPAGINVIRAYNPAKSTDTLAPDSRSKYTDVNSGNSTATKLCTCVERILIRFANSSNKRILSIEI